MDKYYGCNIVESVVTDLPSSGQKKPAPEKKIRYILLRWAAALCAVGFILTLSFADTPALDVVREAFKSVFCYDIFSRAVGSSAFFSFI